MRATFWREFFYLLVFFIVDRTDDNLWSSFARTWARSSYIWVEHIVTRASTNEKRSQGESRIRWIIIALRVAGLVWDGARPRRYSNSGDSYLFITQVRVFIPRIELEETGTIVIVRCHGDQRKKNFQFEIHRQYCIESFTKISFERNNHFE